ncbi:MAG TPA: transcription elongation factor GreA [Melioribacteraceae bacterium]|nr:transcription elongation factor GreA [Melioribacteraceae bacterium]
MSQSGFVNLSREKILEFEAELKELKTTGRKQMAERIAEARSYGDLSENAEYDAAKEAQGLLELKISKLEEMLSKARIIDTSNLPSDIVHILTTVTIKNLNNGKTLKYTMVSLEEADLQSGKLAITSPVGQALMNKKKGDIVEVKVPAGLIKYEILELEQSA